MGYPDAERLDLVDDLHGRPVADPYRWLEDPADPRTVSWSAAQDGLVRPHLDALPGRDTLAATMHRLHSAGSVSPPTWRAGRRFAMRREPGQEHAVLWLTDVDGTQRVLLDPSAIDPSDRTTLDDWTPDATGRQLAYQLSVGGDEHSVLHVMDVDTGAELEPPIDRCRYSDVAWLPGGKEFFLVRMVAPDEVPDGRQGYHRRIWRHRVGTPTGDDVLVDGPGLYDDHVYYTLDVSRDGHWLTVTARIGTARRDSMWIADLTADATLTPVLTQDDDVQCRPWVDDDGLLYLHTTDSAPRWRLAVTDPARPGRQHWCPLLPEDPEAVLRGAGPVPGTPLLVALRDRHAVSEVALHHAADGAPRGTVELPGPGWIGGLTTADHDTPDQAGRLWFGWQDFITPSAVHRHDVATGTTTVDAAPPGSVDVPAALSEQREFTSADGTTVRMFVLTGAGEGPRPTLLTGYGGFGISRPPTFSPSALAWVAAGGSYALVSLRGGSEEGDGWHRAGNRDRKQNVFDDFHAAAQALVAAGTTTPAQLAIMGGSNGGLLVGAALTQRPERYRAVVCSAPLLDMVRYEQFSLGRTWNDEYGTADDPDELAWLLSYSPYHHVEEGTAYPAVLFTVYESDSRVDPVHARKMCAALQHAQAGELPVLIRRETDVGHGARSVSRSVDLAVDQLAFLAHHTGLEL